MNRYPPLALEDMSWEQRRVYQAIMQRRKPSVSSQGGLSGPFVPLVYVPEILDRLQHLGEYCRFSTAVSPKLRELAIIVTARHVSAQLEFYVHAWEAHEFGLAQAVIDAIANQQEPAGMDVEESLIYHFCTSIHKEGQVSDDLFDRFESQFGKGAAIDVMVICGYYGTLGMVLNVSKASPPGYLAGFEPAFSVPND